MGLVVDIVDFDIDNYNLFFLIYFKGDALDLACSNYKDDGSNVCKEQERIALKIKKDDSEGKSIFIPLMNILNSL